MCVCLGEEENQFRYIKGNKVERWWAVDTIVNSPPPPKSPGWWSSANYFLTLRPCVINSNMRRLVVVIQWWDFMLRGISLLLPCTAPVLSLGTDFQIKLPKTWLKFIRYFCINCRCEMWAEKGAWNTEERKREMWVPKLCMRQPRNIAQTYSAVWCHLHRNKPFFVQWDLLLRRSA